MKTPNIDDLFGWVSKECIVKTQIQLDDWYISHSLLNDVNFSLYDVSDLYLVSEEKRDAYRQVTI